MDDCLVTITVYEINLELTLRVPLNAKPLGVLLLESDWMQYPLEDNTEQAHVEIDYRTVREFEHQFELVFDVQTIDACILDNANRMIDFLADIETRFIELYSELSEFADEWNITDAKLLQDIYDNCFNDASDGSHWRALNDAKARIYRRIVNGVE